MNRLSLLVDLASMLGREVDLDALLATACERLAEALAAERATLWLVDAERGDLVIRVAVLPELPSFRQPLGKGIAGWVAQHGRAVRVDDAATDPRFDPSADRATGYRTRNMLVVPVREQAGGPVRGALQVLNRREGTFDDEDERYLGALAMQLGHALSLTTLRPDDATGPGLVLRGPFNRIVGTSEAMRSVYERVALAAQTDATVLLRGETGTGKSLFARAIHVNSPRQARPFVVVDCTTLPAQLVESELFGHERGAFTGADRRVPGMIEQGDGGTIFLDEIGDMPLESQGKLLRFLQEREFTRVGGRETLRADVRVVAATHRPLEDLVAEGRFRQDLYYRLRVVEIEVPPLRARGPDEVERLARHFADLFARRYGRPSVALGGELLARLRAHGFPGNVRELEHWVESATVLSTDGVVRRSLWPEARGGKGRAAGDGVALPAGAPLADAVRLYVAATVAACDGNRSEAARRLGVSRNRVARILGE